MVTIRRLTMVTNIFVIIGSITLFSSYSCWYIINQKYKLINIELQNNLEKMGLHLPNYFISWGFWLDIKYISVYGNWLSFSIIFLGIGKIEKNILLKWALYYNLSIFYLSRLIISASNKFFQYYDMKLNANGAIDDILKTNPIIMSSIICVFISLIWMFYRLFYHKYS